MKDDYMYFGCIAFIKEVLQIVGLAVRQVDRQRKEASN